MSWMWNEKHYIENPLNNNPKLNIVKYMYWNLHCNQRSRFPPNIDIPWNIVEYGGILWNIAEYCGISELVGCPKNMI